MITVHSANADDFSTLGYGALTETEAPIEEHAGGMYQLTLTHPMDVEGRWHYLQKYNIIKAPAPVREVPSFVVQEETPGQTVTRQIYRVDTPSGKRLHLRQKGSLSAKIITMYKPGTEVVRLSVSGDWARVVVCKGGATGYMWADYLKYVRTETETVPGTGGPGKVIQPKQTREQLFRITRPEKDDAAQLIRVKALHISYDLSGNAIRGELELDNVPADEAVERILAQANDEHPFSVYCNSKKPVSGDWTGKSVAAALWGDGGVVQQIGGELIRDNFDIYVLDDAQRDLGAEVRHGKNMLGAVAYEDASGVLTRIIPVGKNKDGSRLMLDGTPYVESPRTAEIPVIRSKEIEYDVQVGSDGISTVAAARAKLRELAAADFANGADGAVVGLDVDFVQLENTVEYAQYADLQTIHLYDIVHVISGRSDIRAGVRMTGYVFEASGPDPHYTAVTLGEITELETTIYGYDLAEGTTPGTKLINNSVSGAKLRNASIEYAKIASAAIEQLVANSITAVRAHINELVAGNITTDQLYADLATLAAAQITAAKIAEANIDWASITTLQAEIASISKAQITAANIEEADIQWAEIDSLAAKIAEIAQAKIDNAEIDAAQITDLEVEVARLVNVSIKSADIGFAQIKDLVAGTAIITQGVGGELYISRLAVTEANMVSLSVGELVVKGSDGHFYALGVDAGGNVTTTIKQVVNDDVADLSINAGEKIIEGTVTAACLNADDIFANNAIIKQLIAANIDVAALFAREATIAQLNAADISGNKYLKLAVEGVEGDIADLDVRVTENASSIRLLEDEISLKVSQTEYYGVKTAEGAIVQADGLLKDQGIRAISSFGPVQAGSGNPSPDNVRPISGRTGAVLTRCGKNLFPDKMTDREVNGVTFKVNADKSITTSGTASDLVVVYIETNRNRLLAGDYILSGCPPKGGGHQLRVLAVDIPGWPYFDDNGEGNRFTLTQDSDVQCSIIIRAGHNVDGLTFYPMLRLASVADAAYEPYQGDTFTADFGETVYGGTIDWNKGVLTVDGKIVTLTGDENWMWFEKYDFLYMNGLQSAFEQWPKDLVCSHYKTPIVETKTNPFVTIVSTGTYIDQLRFYHTGYTSADAWKAYLAAQYAAGTPVQIAYRLAAPATIQLIPQQILALEGLNTVWTDLDSNYVECGHDSLAGLGAASEYDLNALAGRVTTTESQILQKADSIELSVLRTEVEGIEVGGRNLLKGTQNAVWQEIPASGTAVLYAVRPHTELAALGVSAGDTLCYSVGLKTDVAMKLRMIMTTNTSDSRVVDVKGEYFSGEGRAWVSAAVPSTAKYVRMYISSEGAGVTEAFWKGEKLEKGSKPTDWSPAPEDPAKSLVTGTTVTITDEQFNVQTKQAAFSIIDDSSGEAEEKLRIDDDGLTAEEATFGTIHSDSVVGTQAAIAYTPANAGELQAILDDLSNRFLLGDVTIDVRNITGGNFSVNGLTGGGHLTINGQHAGVLNSLIVRNCTARVNLYLATVSTSGTALELYGAEMYLVGVTLNANVGATLDGSRMIMNNCNGTCTRLAESGYASELWIMGSSVPYGVLGEVTGEVYSPLAFTAAPSAPSVETVQTATLNASTTRTWNGGWLSGDALYQGKVASDGSLRRGCMWFDLSAISGKTIIGATLTLKRYDGIGGGGSVSVGIYGTTAASASGTPAVGTKYASVSLANGATKSVDVTAAVQALANGSIKGLMVYDTRTGTYSSKNYTYGYSKFYGSGQSARPVLKVTYK